MCQACKINDFFIPGVAEQYRSATARTLGQLNWNQLTLTKFAPVLVVNVT
jgi:hypothetical protein